MQRCRMTVDAENKKHDLLPLGNGLILSVLTLEKYGKVSKSAG